MCIRYRYISELGKYIKDSWKDIAKRNELDIDIFGLSSITKYTLKTKNDFIKYKTLIAQEMLKRGFLATNSVYVSLAHDKKLVDEYIDSLNEVFGMISKCEDTDLDINELLDDEICHVDFTRLN